MKKTIDLDDVLARKSPRLHRWLPSILTHYLKKIIHQEEINEIIIRYGNLRGIDFNNAVVAHFGYQIEVENAGKVPKGPAYVFFANHPWGGMDGLVLMQEVTRHFGPSQFIVNDLLKAIENFGEIFVGVNTLGRSSPEQIRQLEAAFAGPGNVIVFPAGLVSRRQGGQVRDLAWKTTFLRLALAHGKALVPVHVEGELSPFFYRLHRLRKAFGIRANIEMLFLVDEMFKTRRQSIRLRLGEPIPPSFFGKGRDLGMWTERLKSYLYQMPATSLTFQEQCAHESDRN